MEQVRPWLVWFAQPLQMLVVAQLGFLFVGIQFLEFNVTALDVVASAAAAVAVEFAGSYREARKKRVPHRWFIPSSALAAALGIGIFFRATNPWYFALAAAVAIASKYTVRLRGVHIFNPSNFGIVALVLLAPHAATIEFTQWGHSPYVYAAVAAISFYIAYRAGVFLTTVSFLASYTVLLIASLSLSKSLFSLHHYGLIGPSFVLFASFMITDPKTAPREFRARILHGFCIAVFYFFLESTGVRYALFIASFSVALANALLPRLLERFPLPDILPANAATAALGVALLIGSYATLSSRYTVSATIFIPSPQFLLFGVESAGVHICRTDALFSPSPDAAIRTSDPALGAAWADYDLDGDDDLFLSSIRGQSRLYRNMGQGVFEDVSAAAGVSPTIASAAFFADYNNDSKPDLFVFGVPKKSPDGPLPPERLDRIKEVRVYRNVNGSFVEATGDVGLNGYVTRVGTMTASFADYDRNGTLDLLVVETGQRSEFLAGQNEALKKALFDPYIKKTSSVVCAEGALEVLDAHAEMREEFETKMSAETFLEQRGCLVVTNRIDVGLQGALAPLRADSPILDATLLIPGTARLFLNNGGRFREDEAFSVLVDSVIKRGQQALSTSTKTAESLANNPDAGSFFQSEGSHPYAHVSGAFFQAVSFDYNQDALPDVFFVSDFGANLLLKNEGHGRFREATADAGLDYYGTGMGIAIGDYDNDTLPDIFVTNSLGDGVYRNRGDGTFENQTKRFELSGIGVGWGAAFLDYDGDGQEDVYIANGDNTRTIESPDPQLQRPLLRQDALYRNRGAAGFEDRTGIDLCEDAASAYPLAVSDFDNDGDPDVFIGNTPLFTKEAQSNVLMENRLPKGKAHFITVKLKGTRSNSFGVGAVVSVSYEGVVRTKFALLGESFHAQHSSALLFGLGTYEGRVNIDVQWPSGAVTRRSGMATDRTVLVEE